MLSNMLMITQLGCERTYLSSPPQEGTSGGSAVWQLHRLERADVSVRIREGEPEAPVTP